MKAYRSIWGMTILMVWLLQGSAAATTVSPDTVQMEEVVVTATGTEVPLKDATQAVTVITEKQIQEQQAVRVEEMLRFVPGVTINQSGSRGGTTSLFLRGGNANNTQVLFNGIQLNDAGGNFDFNALTTDNLSRIEVVRGPMSALYGADAMVGVVNLMTLKGVGPPTLNLAAGAGPHVENGYATEEYRATLLGSYKKFGFSIGYTHLFDPGILAFNNRYRNNALVARLDFDPLDNLSITYYTLYLNNRFEFPTENGGDLLDRKSRGGPGFDPDQNSSKQDLLQGLAVNYSPFPWWQNQLTLGLTARQRHLDDPANPPANDFQLLFGNDSSVFDYFFGSFNSKERELRYTLDYRSNFTFGTREKVQSISTLGFYAREENFKQWVWTGNGLFSTPTNSFLGTRRGATAFYAQQQLNLKNRVFLVGGFRVENSSVFNQAEFIPRASAAVRFPKTNTTLRAAGGRAIKEPTFLESFSRSQLSAANPNLKPEQNVSWEVGIDQYFFNNHGQISVTYFENYFNDFITFVPRVFPLLSTFENIGAVRISGLESSVFVNPAPGFTLGIVYTNLFTRVADDGDIKNIFFQTGKPLLRRPRNTFSFVANYNWKRLNVNFNGVYTGWRDDSRFTFEYPFLFTASRVDNRDYFLLNLAATYDLVRDRGYVKTVQLWARLNNILDTRYQETYGFSSPGFYMLGGVRVIFGVKSAADEKKKAGQPPASLRSRFAPGLAATQAEGNGI